MKKIILGLFIILFCFSIGIAELQEKELSKEERAKNLDKQLEIIDRIISLYDEIEKLEKELNQLGKQNDFSFLDRIKPLEEKKKDDVMSLDSLYESYGLDKTEAAKLEEENDRLEDLLEDLRKERSGLEWDMMRYRWELELAKPDPLDYQIALNSVIASAMIAPNPFKYDSWFYPYYPSYSMKTDRINYEPLLFTLCTDSKGKMDWTKYGWLKILLKNK